MLIIPELTPETIARFKAKYIECAENECWPWIAACDTCGYGNFGFDHSYYKAHRIALAIVGIRSDCLQVRHSCNNPPCVNPAHLSFGTSKEDAHDRRVAGTLTLNRGSMNGNSILIEADIPIILELTKFLIQREIADLYNVKQSLISRIVTGKAWAHV